MSRPSFNRSTSSSSSSHLSANTAATTPDEEVNDFNFRTGVSRGREGPFIPTQNSSSSTQAAPSAPATPTIAILTRESDGSTRTILVEEANPLGPLDRTYDPTRDSLLSIEALLARPRLPRTPYERLQMIQREEESQERQVHELLGRRIRIQRARECERGSKENGVVDDRPEEDYATKWRRLEFERVKAELRDVNMDLAGLNMKVMR